jgi:hypothetical protein
MVCSCGCPRALSFSRLQLGGLAVALFAGCSAPPGSLPEDDEESGAPPYMGSINGNLPAGAGASSSSPSTAEGNPGNVPINNNGMMAGTNPASMGAAGAGGAPGAMAPGMVGNPGGAGSSGMPPQMRPPPMMGTAGSNNMPPQMMPPPVQPPPVQPPFVGPGCDGSAFFCEDFEGLALGAVQANADFTPSTANGTLSIDSAIARGQRSLHVQTQGNGRAAIQLNGFTPPNNSFFARMYVQAQAFPTAPDYAHFTLVEATGTGAGLIRPIGGQFIPGMGTLWGAGSDAGPTGDWTNWRASAPTVAGRFLCIEWEMNSADNNINVWIDSQAKTELSVSTRSHGGSAADFVFPRFNNLWIGWQLYQGGSTPNQFNLWFDDIVFSTRRVGC